MPTEEAFLARLADHPDDDTTRLIYADWLEDRGDPRAAYLRAEVDLARMEPGTPEYHEGELRLVAAREGLSADWVASACRVYDLVLWGYPAGSKIAVIKSIRELTRCGLAEAKEISESLPATILGGVSRPQAEHGRERLGDFCTGPVQAVIQPSPAGTPNHAASLGVPPDRPWPPPGLYSLVLIDHAPEQKIAVIRALRVLTGLGLAECKRRVEAPRPLLLLHNVTPEVIRLAQEQLGPGVVVQVVHAEP